MEPQITDDGDHVVDYPTLKKIEVVVGKHRNYKGLEQNNNLYNDVNNNLDKG